MYHIGLLIMAALYYFAPAFIKEGRLCWLRSPLYIQKNSRTERYYFTDAEMLAAKGKYTGEVQRNKGLGSLSPQQARVSMFTPEYQHLETLTMDESTEQILLALMGEDVEPRREFIMNNIDFSTIHE